MLPRTHSGSAAPLVVLNHAPTRPTWCSEHSQALVALKEIERICVSSAVDASGRKRRTYVVEAYRAASMNRIPTNQKKDTVDELSTEQQTEQRLESHVERSSDDFDHFRSKIYRHTRKTHGTKLCTFCEQVMEELVTDSANPNVVTKLLIGEAKVIRRLAKFLNRMLEFTKSGTASQGERPCSGQVMTLVLLHNFLVSQDALSA